MRDHTDADMLGDTLGSDTYDGRTRSGATLSLVPGPASGNDGVDGGASTRAGHRPVRRRAPGPRPVRPAAGPAGAGSAPACRTVSRRPGQVWPEPRSAGRERVLVRHLRRPSEPLALRFRVRRAVAGMVAVLVMAAVVVGLGLLADVASAARHATPGERIVTGDSLTSVQVRSGQVLRVPLGRASG